MFFFFGNLRVDVLLWIISVKSIKIGAARFAKWTNFDLSLFSNVVFF